jgi:HEAT repeat protein
MSLKAYLDELADQRTELTQKQLARLSRLGADEIEELRQSWQKLGTERRREVVQRASSIIEDDIESDFDDLFKVGLDDEDSAVRIASIQGLWEYTGRDLIRRLVSLLKDDSDPGVRSTAALALGRYIVLGEFDEIPPEYVKRAEDALRQSYEEDPEVEVRARCLESIGASSQPYVRDLITRSHESGNYRLRLSAIHAMGRNCDERWMPILLQEMTDDEPEVRFEAVGAVGQVADESAINAIAELIEDEDREVQFAAIEALGHIGGRRVKQHLRLVLKSGDEALRDAAQQALDEADFEEDPMTKEYQI